MNDNLRSGAVAPVHVLGPWAVLLCLCQPLHAEYGRNTDVAAPRKTLEAGGMILTIEDTIRLTPAPISAMHPFMKSIRLDNGDLLFGCPLSGGSFRDEALSPKEDGTVCSLRSTDGGRTWRKARSDTTMDGGKTWVSEPAMIRRAARLDDGSWVADYERNMVCWLSEIGRAHV